MTHPVENHYTQIEGLKLHYLEAGQGPSALLLHGWPTSSFLWRRMLPNLAASHRVIAPDWQEHTA